MCHPLPNDLATLLHRRRDLNFVELHAVVHLPSAASVVIGLELWIVANKWAIPIKSGHDSWQKNLGCDSHLNTTSFKVGM